MRKFFRAKSPSKLMPTAVASSMGNDEVQPQRVLPAIMLPAPAPLAENLALFLRVLLIEYTAMVSITDEVITMEYISICGMMKNRVPLCITTKYNKK